MPANRTGNKDVAFCINKNLQYNRAFYLRLFCDTRILRLNALSDKLSITTYGEFVFCEIAFTLLIRRFLIAIHTKSVGNQNPDYCKKAFHQQVRHPQTKTVPNCTYNFKIRTALSCKIFWRTSSEKPSSVSKSFSHLSGVIKG